MSLLIILLLIGIAGPLIWLSFERGRAAALADANRQMTALSERTMDRYRLLFADAVPILNMLSVAEATATSAPDAVTAKRQMLVEALADAPHLDGIYCAYPDGSFAHLVRLAKDTAWRTTLGAPAEAFFAFRTIFTPNKGGRMSYWQFLNEDGKIIAALPPSITEYDPRLRPWYKLASTVPGIVSDGPYITATTKSLAVTVAKAHVTDGRIVIGADILLDTIAQFLSQEKVSPGSAAFVLDSQGNLLIRTDGAQPAAAVDDPLLAMVRRVEAGPSSRIETVENGGAGEKYIVKASRIEFSPLLQGNILAVAAPLRDFTAESERLLLQGVGFSLALLLAGVASAIVISRFITRSLSRLTADAVQLGNLEIRAPRPEPSYVTEINLLSDALAVARDAIRNFALYVPRELVRKIVSNKGTVALGERLDVSVIFTDIRGFTTISENNAPEDVVSWLSAYFELMNETVEENNGTIIQFLGDSIYAMWNAPVSDPAHVD
ncbi:MAG: cache domain-containing protein, partial [Parvibaculaceae bacterium]